MNTLNHAKSASDDNHRWTHAVVALEVSSARAAHYVDPSGTMRNVPLIFDYEVEALLQALRRDFRTEQQKARTDMQYREDHLHNARCVIRLLEALNPRGAQRNGYPVARAAEATAT